MQDFLNAWGKGRVRQISGVGEGLKPIFYYRQNRTYPNSDNPSSTQHSHPAPSSMLTPTTPSTHPQPTSVSSPEHSRAPYRPHPRLHDHPNPTIFTQNMQSRTSWPFNHPNPTILGTAFIPHTHPNIPNSNTRSSSHCLSPTPLLNPPTPNSVHHPHPNHLILISTSLPSFQYPHPHPNTSPLTIRLIPTPLSWYPISPSPISDHPNHIQTL